MIKYMINPSSTPHLPSRVLLQGSPKRKELVKVKDRLVRKDCKQASKYEFNVVSRKQSIINGSNRFHGASRDPSMHCF
jgi:hypothetical protein